MAQIAGRQLHKSTLTALDRDLRDLFAPLTQQLQGILLSYRDAATGAISSAQATAVRREAGAAITALFTASAANSPHADGRAAYGADFTGGETMPLAPYPRLLNNHLARVTAGVVGAHYRFLQKQLPGDVFAWLQSALISEQILPPANVFVAYEPPHTWVDPRGYRLSDRIWETSQETRRRIDQYLLSHIGAGDSVEGIAKGLEVYLKPGAKLKRTRMPYGRDASFHAMRLARTEVLRAEVNATYIAGLSNPFVAGFDWALSNRHPEYDICDRYATLSMSGERLKAPYPKDSNPPRPIEKSHPMCICAYLPAVSATPAEVVAELRAAMGRGEAAPLTPAQPQRFLERLLGAYLASFAINYLQEL